MRFVLDCLTFALVCGFGLLWGGSLFVIVLAILGPILGVTVAGCIGAVSGAVLMTWAAGSAGEACRLW